MYAFLLFTDQPRSLLSRRPMQVCDAGLEIYCIVYGQYGDIFRERYNCKQLNDFFVGLYRLIELHT